MSNTKKSNMRDMTAGNPMSLIIGFAIPLIMGSIFQQLYNLVDTIIVGKYLGLSALSAVGSTGSVTFLILGFCMGMCQGFGIPVAQKFGAQRYDSMRKYIANASYLARGMSAVITVRTVLLCRTILTVMKTPADIIDGSYAYLVIIFAGIPFTVLYNTLSSFIRALGDSKTPFKFLVLSAILNVILDLVFIIVLKIGVAGAAYATIISQAVSGILCLIYMKNRYPVLKFEKGELAIVGRKMRKLCMMGLPMGLQFSITAIGTVMLQSAVNSLGTVYVASYTATQKIKQFAMAPFDGFASASATFVSQNLGAGNLDRIPQGVKSATIVSEIYGFVVGLIFMTVGGRLALIFVDAAEVEVLSLVTLNLKCVSFFFMIVAALNVIRMSVQGLGYSGLAMIAGLSELIARGVMALFVIPATGYIGVCFTDQTAWIAATVVVSVEFLAIMKKLRAAKSAKA